MRALGFILAVAGVLLVAQSAGTVNGGFVVGAPVSVLGVFLMTKEYKRERQEEGHSSENEG